MNFFTRYSSPIGILTLISDGRNLTGLWMDTQEVNLTGCSEDGTLPIFRDVISWLDGYFQGKSSAVSFPLSPEGTAFQQRVWKILQQVPYGETTTYGCIARQISPAMSAQAVGGAVGRNPISIIIPCHRCTGSKGQLTGYAGGLENKKWLLNHEQINNSQSERRE